MVLLVVALAALVGRVAPVSAQTATVSAVTLASTSRTTATATVTVSGAGTFYLRFSLEDENDWQPSLTATATGAGDVTVALTGLAANAYYDVEVSADSTFATGVESSTFQNRPAHLDFTLAGSDLPTGIAGDANTFWVISDAFTLGVPTTIRAYKRALAAQQGERDVAKDITPHFANHTPGGLWSDGTFLYAVDRSQLRTFVYRLSDSSQVPGREFTFVDDFDPKGIWANSDTFWVVNPQHDAYAYKRTPSVEYGRRDTAKDITLHEGGSYALGGIWSDRQTIWVVDGRDRMLYAVDLKLGIPRPRLNVRLSTAHTTAVNSLGASGLWGDGEYLWVLDGRRSGSKVFVYYQPKPDPSVTALSIVSARSTAITIRADIAYPDVTKTVYLRYREPFSDTWSTTNGAGGQTIDFTLSGPPSAARLVVQASLDSTFSDGTEVTAELLVRPVQRDFALPEVTGQVRGIWTDGTTLWAVDDTDAGGVVYAYNQQTKVYTPAKSFPLAAGNTAPRGVYANSSTMWVVDEQDKVYAYSLSSRPIGEPDSTKDLKIPTGSHPRGAWSNGTTMWIAGHVREHVFAYNVGSSGTFGARDTTKEGDLASSYAQPRGMWSNGSTLWVVDDALDRIYAYALGSGGVGGRQPLREINLVRENGAPWGIASGGTILWVADEAKRKVYAYNLPAAPSGNITDVQFGDAARTTASVTVTIANSDSTEQTVALKYRAQPDGADQDVSKMTSGTSVAFDLTGLAMDTLHALLVTLGDDVELHTPGFKTQSESEQRGHFLKTQVVSVYETANPWVRELYDNMRRLNLSIRGIETGAMVFLDCTTRRIENLAGCEVTGVDISNSARSDPGVYLHELGHIYNAGARYMGEDSEGRGIAWLYFANLVAGGTGCRIHEIYADAVESGTVAGSLSTYFPPCTNTGDTPSPATLAMIRSVLAKTMPDWFNTTYEDDTVAYDTSTDAKYDKKYDLEQVWTDVKGVGTWRHAAAFALRNAFGGYCDPARATDALVLDTPTRNPWRAGGCVPQAPAAVSLASDGRVTWETPPYDGGEGITRYLLTWKDPDQEYYDVSRSHEFKDLSGILAYATTATAPGSSVLIAASNRNGISETAEVMQPLDKPGVPGVSSVTAGDGELTVRWSAPASDGGADITSYDLRSIRTDAMNKADDQWTEVIPAWTAGDLEDTISGLTNGFSHDVQVRAVNSAGDGDWSDTSTGTPLSADATLSALSLSGARLSPSFASEDTSYTASVGYTVTGITVTASENDAGAETTLVSPVDTDTNVDGYQVNLSVGQNDITIKVTAANGSTRTYIVTVTRTRQDTSLTPPASDPVAPFPSTATYDVEFEGKWDAKVTPDGVPGGAHFSRLAGAVHNAGVSFLESGGTASPGVESMAEDGTITTLRSEVQTAIDASPATALSLFQGSTDTGGVTATQTLNPTLATTHPRVTLVTMIAPSPDWFVGVSGLPLLNSSGRWLRSHSINLYPWDAGTEEGTGFSRTNAETDPQGVITSIRGTGKFSTEPIATLSFALQSVSTTRTVEENTPGNRNIGPPIAAAATDGSTTYTLGGADAASFAIVAASGQLRTEAALNYETKASYEVDVTATDANGSAVTKVTVRVTNVNEMGSLGLSSVQPQVEAAFTATLTDLDIVQSTTWTWERSTNSGGGWQAISGATADSYTPVEGDIGYFLRATARYTDGHGTGKSVSTVSVNRVEAKPHVNTAPEFPSSSTTRSVPENTPAGVDIGDPVEASDDDGDDLTYTLDRASRNLFDIGAGGQLRTRAALDHEARSSYSVTVTATDRSGTSDSIRVTITVNDVEETPAFDSASTTRSVNENTPAGRPIGDPVAATDGDRDVLTYSLGGADAASFAIDSSTGRLRTRAALDHETRASYSLTVRVSDRTNADGEPVDETDPDVDDTISVTIGVGDVEEAPAFDSASTTRSVAENTPAERNIGDPVEASDDDGDALSYSLTGAGAALFAIDASSGQIETKAPLDFETVPNTYSLTVRVSDRMNAGGEPVADTVPDIDDSIAVTITVTNVNEAPTLSGRERINAREIATVEVTTYEAVDPEHDDLTWSLSGTDSDDFTISSSGALAFSSLPDFERPTDSGRNNVYQFTLQVSDAKSATGDPDPAIDATLDITVTVTNVGERGEITVSPSPARVGVTLTASLSDPDGGVTNLTWQWQISASGASWSDIAGATSAGYTPLAADEGRFLRVSAAYSDDQARATTAEATLAGAVQSAPNTPPRFRASSTSRSVPENTPARQNIGAPVTASDDDGDTLSYTLGGTDAAAFTIVAGSGQLQTRAALDFETPRTYSVSVSVSDGKNADGDDDPASDDTISVTISATDVNEPPVFPGTLRTALRVDENTPASQNIGDPLSASDEDVGATLTYSLGGTAAGSFTIAAGGQLQTSAALDFETRSTYSLSARVSDGYDANGDEDNTADASIAITVTVDDIEEDGAISVPTDQPQVGAALTASLDDPDGGITGVTWQWQVSDDQSAWSGITTATSASYTPVAGDESRYLRVTASYSDRRGSGKEAETSLPNPVQAAPAVNRPPRFPAPSTSRSVPENTPRGEDIGAPVTAADSDALKYALSGDHARFFTIAEDSGQLRTDAALDHESRSSYSLTVTATDPSTTSDSIAVTINVTDRNEPPAFPTSLRAPLSVDENTAAGRNIGSPLTAIDEDDGDSLIYSLDSAGDAFFDIDPDKGLLRTEAPLNHEMTDSYRVVVQVSDGDDDDGKPDPASDDTLTLTVRVNDRNEPPVVSGETSISYAEDRSDAVATYAHNDPDENASITWSLSGPDAGDFAIDASGVLSFAGPPDHDDPRDHERDNEYHVTVTASDGSLRDSLDVTVTVTGVNERPQLSGPAAVSYREDRTDAVASYAHNDPDQPPTITWSLSGDDASQFAISAAGVLSFREAPNHERARDANRENDYELTVSASDGSLDDSLDVTVTVTDVNEPPTLTGRTSITVDEHAERFVAGYSADDPDADAVLAWTLSGGDARHFRIDQDGELRFRLEPDFESPSDAGGNNVYNLSVHIFDGANMPSLNVTVTVQNVDEPGSIALTSIQPQVGTALTASLSDPDGRLLALVWQWQSFDNGVWSDITGATSARYTPVATDVGKSLRVTASYTDGHGPDKDAATVLDAVRAAPATNTPPAFSPAETGLRSIPENTLAGQPIGDPVQADDANGDRLTYSLDRAAEEVFDIVPESGQLLTAAPLDYEQRTSYTVTVTATDPSLDAASVAVTIAVEDEDEPPTLSGATVVSVAEQSTGSVATYTATDPEERDLIWSLGGTDEGAFELAGGVLSFLAPPDFESPANVAGVNTYELTVAVSDGTYTVTRAVTVIVTDVDESATGPSPVTRGLIGGGGGGGGGGGPTGPSPSTVDFEWTVKHDLEELDPAHDKPTGSWSDGLILWIAENGDGADDSVYAYDLKTGERLEQREFELDEANRAPRGVWSDGTIIWVSDSGRNRLFAHDLETGKRLPEHDLDLDTRNRAAGGIWSDRVLVWVLDGGKDSLFAYDLGSGESLAEYALDDANGDPRGLWSDGVTLWVADHGAKRLFAYRLPTPEGPAAEDAEPQDLERVSDEEFKELSKASNNSPRGLWSDGEVMYVADESDHKVYSYNMPDALDARLASLTLSGVDFGEFDPGQTEYEGSAGEGVTETTVDSTAMQRRTSIVIAPPDADMEADGHQVALEALTEITATVTSADGSREKVYRVSFPGVAWDPARDPWPHCLRGAVSEGFSLVVFEGGTFDKLVACAESRDIVALYALHEGVYVPYILGAPDFVNRKFRELFADGLPVMTPLVVGSNEPPSADPFGDDLDDAGQQPWSECLRGDIVEGFSLVVYEDGTVEELVACAESRHVTALYALHEGEFVPYILGGPDFVNQRFRDLFLEGVPAITALVAKSEGPPAGGPDRDDAARN